METTSTTGSPEAPLGSLPEDERLRERLASVNRVAVIGIKAGERDDAFRVPRYLQARGVRLLPVNPKLESVLGERAYASIADVPEPVDLVNVFRASPHVAGHAEEILRLSPRPRGVWLQLGIRDDDAVRRLADAGLWVVQDRCLMVEHHRLFPLETP